MEDKDEEFDFPLRDKLKENQCHHGFKKHPKHYVIMDMITYCSLGNKDTGLRSVRWTDRVLFYIRHPFQDLGVSESVAHSFIFEFWRYAFIRTRFAISSNHEITDQERNRFYKRLIDIANWADTWTGTYAGMLAVVRNKTKTYKTRAELWNKHIIKHFPVNKE